MNQSKTLKTFSEVDKPLLPFPPQISIGCCRPCRVCQELHKCRRFWQNLRIRSKECRKIKFYRKLSLITIHLLSESRDFSESFWLLFVAFSFYLRSKSRSHSCFRSGRPSSNYLRKYKFPRETLLIKVSQNLKKGLLLLGTPVFRHPLISALYIWAPPILGTMLFDTHLKFIGFKRKVIKLFIFISLWTLRTHLIPICR